MKMMSLKKIGKQADLVQQKPKQLPRKKLKNGGENKSNIQT